MYRYLFPSRNFGLLWQLVVREVLQRFKGSWLGLGWSLLTPVAMLVVYTFVFRTVLKARWPGAEDSNSEFALQIFSGLLVFSLFSEVIGRAPKLVLEQPNLVKKVIFPLEILPWSALLASYFHAVLSVFVLLGGTLFFRGELTMHVLAVPVVLLAFMPVMLGLSWFLAALGVYMRDIGHVVGLILTPLLFLSPVFYPTSALPEFVQNYMMFNPLALIIESLRDVMLSASWPDFTALGIYFVVGLSVAVVGAWCFEKTRRGFADVL